MSEIAFSLICILAMMVLGLAKQVTVVFNRLTLLEKLSQDLMAICQFNNKVQLHVLRSLEEDPKLKVANVERDTIH